MLWPHLPVSKATGKEARVLGHGILGLLWRWPLGTNVILDTWSRDQKGAGPEKVIIGGVTNTGTNVQVLRGRPQDNRLEDRLL